MKILVIHQGFPGQFKHLIPYLESRGDEISTICPARKEFKFAKSIGYYPYIIKKGSGSNVHPLALETETKVIRGEAVAYIANQLANAKYNPNLILAHPGWGEVLFLNDVWPDVPQLHYVEFFYRCKGTDSDFPCRYILEQTLFEKARGTMKNANVLLNLQAMSWGITPTAFQHAILPDWAKSKTNIIHDGIDTNWATPDYNSTLRLSENLFFSAADEIITFVNRTYEPYRGIHTLLEALPVVLRDRPNAHVLLVGHDTPKVSYGAHRNDGLGWLTALRNELKTQLDWSRVHDLGTVSHDTLRKVFRISSAHVYLTVPFVLSWSLLEAMSCEALIIGSSTAPVQEVIKHGQNGLLIPFDSPKLLAQVLVEVLSHPKKFVPLRKAARSYVIKHFELSACLRKQVAIIDALANKSISK